MLADKIAVITGAAQGIGFAIARRFCIQGATVVLVDVDATAAAAAAAKLSETGRAESRGCDVLDEISVDALIAGVVADHGRLDVVVNNAGITRDAPAHRMTMADFDAVVAVTLRGSWLVSRAALAHMRTRPGGGAIINMSSTSGKIGNFGQTNYSAAKAGIVGLTKAFAKEGARFDVRVNALQPGLIRTAMTESMPARIWEAKLADVPLGRPGEPDEVAKVAQFLASDLASYVTGEVIEIGGGRSM